MAAPQGTSEERLFQWQFTGLPKEPEYPFTMFRVVSTNFSVAKSTESSCGTK
jgi:hypothetical protein